MTQERLEGEGEHFVGAIADEDVVQLHAVALCEFVAQRRRFGVGIEAQPLVELGLDGGEYPRRRAVRMLVGVQFDEIGDSGLLARNVGGEPLDGGAPVTIVHAPFSRNRGCYA